MSEDFDLEAGVDRARELMVTINNAVRHMYPDHEPGLKDFGPLVCAFTGLAANYAGALHLSGNLDPDDWVELCKQQWELTLEHQRTIIAAVQIVKKMQKGEMDDE